MLVPDSHTKRDRNVKMTPELQNFITRAAEANDTQLVAALRHFGLSWNRPRGDLFQWIPLLNRFDTVLEDIVKKYQLDSPDAVPVAVEPIEETLLVEVLQFTSLLLNNCANRSLYASAHRVYELLDVVSLPVLRAVLRVCSDLGLRFLQTHSLRYTAPTATEKKIMHVAFMLNLPGRPGLAAESFTLHDYIHSRDLWPASYAEVALQYFAGAGGSGGGANSGSGNGTGNAVPNVEETPKRPSGAAEETPHRSTGEIPSPPTEGTVTYRVASGTVLSHSRAELVARAVPHVPRKTLFELQTSLAVAQSFGNTEEARQQRFILLQCLLYAMSYLVCIQDEMAFKTAVLEPMPYLLGQCVELIHPANSVELPVRLAVLKLFECMSLEGSYHLELLKALGGHVNHGELAFILRHIAKEGEGEEVGIVGEGKSENTRKVGERSESGEPVEPVEPVESVGETEQIANAERAERAEGSGIFEPQTGKGKEKETTEPAGTEAEIIKTSDTEFMETTDSSQVSNSADPLILPPSPSPPPDADEEEFAVRLLDVVRNLAANPYVGNMIYQAGALPILRQLAQNAAKHVRTATMAVLTVETLITTDVRPGASVMALDGFIDSGGIPELVGMVCREVEIARATAGPDQRPSFSVVDYQIAYRRAIRLKILVKFVLHLVQINSGADRMRNLFDSPVLGALNEIISEPEVFGAAIISATLNTISAIIHNEPTSYPILAEAGTVQQLLEKPEKLMLPNGDVMLAYLEVLGAVCLNADGLKRVQEGELLGYYFYALTADGPARAIYDAGASASIGKSLEELMRHYPVLKPTILPRLAALVPMMNMRAESEFRGTCDDSAAASEAGAEVQPDGTIVSVSKYAWDAHPESFFFEHATAMLLAVLKSRSHVPGFVELLKLDDFFKLFWLQNAPYDYLHSHAVYSLLVLGKLVVEQRTPEAAAAVAEPLVAQLKAVASFLEHNHVSSGAYFQDIGTEAEKTSEMLTALQTLVGMLCAATELFCDPLATNSQATFQRHMVLHLATLGADTNVFGLLGALLHSCAMEEALLRQPLDAETRRQTFCALNDEFGAYNQLAEPPETAEPPTATEDKLAVTVAQRRLRAVRFAVGGCYAFVSRIFCALVKSQLSGQTILGNWQLRKATVRATVEIGASLSHMMSQYAGTVADVPADPAVARAVSATRYLVVLTCCRFLLTKRTEQLESMCAVAFLQAGGFVALRHVLLGCLRRFKPSHRELAKKVGLLPPDDAVEATEYFTVWRIATLLEAAVQSPTHHLEQLQPFLYGGGRKLPSLCHILGVQLRFVSLGVVEAVFLPENSGNSETSEPLAERGSPQILGALIDLAVPLYHSVGFSADDRQAGGAELGTLFRVTWEDVQPSEVATRHVMELGDVPEPEVRAALDGGPQQLAAQFAGTPLGAALAERPPPLPELVAVPPQYRDCHTQAELEAALTQLKPQLLPAFLGAVQKLPGAVFELHKYLLHDLLPTRTSGSPDASVADVILARLAGLDAGSSEGEPQVAVLLKLLALLFDSQPIWEAARSRVGPLVSALLALLQPEHRNRQWVPDALQVLERVLAGSVLPKYERPHVQILLEEFQPVAELPGPGRQQLLEFLLGYTEFPSPELAVAVTRVLCFYAREFGYAGPIVQSGVVRAVVSAARKFPKWVGLMNLQGLTMVLLRHIVETPESVRKVILANLRSTLGVSEKQPKVSAHLLDVLNARSPDVIRSPEIFTDCTAQVVRLEKCATPVKWDIYSCLEWFAEAEKKPAAAPGDGAEVKTESKAEGKAEGKSKSEAEAEAGAEADVDAEMTDADADANAEVKREGKAENPKSSGDKTDAPSTPVALPTWNSGVMHLLLSELMALKRDVMVDDVPTEGSDGSEAKPTPAPSQPDSRKSRKACRDRESPELVYASFLLHCIIELLASYKQAKFEFLMFSRKQQFTSVAQNSEIGFGATITKLRPAALNFFLCTLSARETLTGEPSSSRGRRRKAIAELAGTAVLALMSSPPEYRAPHSFTELAAAEDEEMLFIRRYVAEGLCRAVKEVQTCNLPVTARYERLMDLADLTEGILSSRFRDRLAGCTARSSTSRDSDYVAKALLEKGVQNLLVSVLADLDFNFPDAPQVVKAALWPVKKLAGAKSRLGEFLPTRGDSGAEAGAEAEGEAAAEAEDEFGYGSDDESAEERDDTPDLFRNSTLGMYDMDDSEAEEALDELGPDDISIIDDTELTYADVDGVEIDAEGEEEGESDSSNLAMDEPESDSDGAQSDYYLDEMELGSGAADGESDSESNGESESDDGMLGSDSESGEESDSGAEYGEWFADEFGAELGSDYDSEAEAEAEAALQALEDEEEEGNEEPEEEEVDAELQLDLGPRAAGRGDHWLSDALERRGRFLDDEWSEDELGGRRGSLGGSLGGARRGGPGPERFREDLGVFDTEDDEDDEGSDEEDSELSDQSDDELLGAEFDATGLQLRASEANAGPMRVRRGVEGFSLLAPRGRHGSRGRGSFADPLAGPQIEREVLSQFLRHMNFAHLGAVPTLGRGSGLRVYLKPEVAKLTQYFPYFPLVSTAKRWAEAEELFLPSLAGLGHLRVVPSITARIYEPSRVLEEERKRKMAEERLEKQKRKEQRLKLLEERRAKRQRQREEAAAAQREANAQQAGTGGTGSGNGGAETATGDGRTGETGETEEPILVQIGDRQVDIRGLGMDRDFLEALPEAMREEVFEQYMAETYRVPPVRRRSTAVPEIDIEFFDALPESIREEILAQQEMDELEDVGDEEAIEDEVEDMEDEDDEGGGEGEEGGEGGEGGGGAGAAEPSRATGGATGGTASGSAAPPKPKSVAPFLDKPAIAALMRLLFAPQDTARRETLERIVDVTCANRQSRNETLTFLTTILLETVSDNRALARCFAQITVRSNTALPPNSRLSTPRKFATPQKSFTKAELSGLFPRDCTPVMVLNQGIQLLDAILEQRPEARAFFLTEHEPIGGKKKTAGRKKEKEKEKEKDNGKDSGKSSRYPINALLGLLETPTARKSAVWIELITCALSHATKPLLTLAKRQQTGSGPEPPNIPAGNLKLLVSVFTDRECSARTFRHTLAVMQHISALPEAKKLFAAELSEKAANLGKLLVGDLQELLETLQATVPGADLPAATLAQFSSSGSRQSKLLRVLTALDYLFASEADKKGGKGAEGAEGTERTERTERTEGATETRESRNAGEPGETVEPVEPVESVESVESGAPGKSPETSKTPSGVCKSSPLTQLYEKLALGPLWSALSRCLAVMQSRADLAAVVTVLLPLMESLMVVCKHSRVRELPMKEVVRYEARTTDLSQEPIERLFFSFTEEHKKILNQMVRHSPKLMSGPFAMLVKNPKVLEFDNKRNYFNRKLHGSADKTYTLPVHVRRENVFLDSYRTLFFKSAEEIKHAKLDVVFRGEAGVDAGGVSREWYQVLSRQMFNPDYALFTPVSSDRTTFHPNRTSWVNPEHLSFFKFIGRIIAKAIYDQRFLDCHFSRAVYKRLLGKPVSLKDMETLDLDYYKSMVWMLENDITDIIVETFSIETDDYGERKIIDLIPDGRNVAVTEANKQEYVRLMVEYKLQTSIQEQMDAFLTGFHEIIPKELISIFDEQELELLISGLPDIDVDDWRNNTSYVNYTPSSPQIQWFWRAVRSFDVEERAKLLQFATGTSKVPLNGFKELGGVNGVSKFSIHRDYGSKDRLPQSHTCFNQIDLPEYESYETLRGSLLLAVTEGHEGFGIA